MDKISLEVCEAHKSTEEDSSDVKPCSDLHEYFKNMKTNSKKLSGQAKETLPANRKGRCNDIKLRISPVITEEKSLWEMGCSTYEVKGWEDIIQAPKKIPYKLLDHIIHTRMKPNVQIEIGKAIFNCHMEVLQYYSGYFMEFSHEALIQLPAEKITPAAFVIVYNWMIANQPLIAREGILELWKAAHFLRIENLIQQIWSCLSDVRFTEDAAFLLYLEARNSGMEDMRQSMLMRVCKFFLTVVASKEFLALSAKEICFFLSSDNVGVNSEIEILMSAVRWLNHDWPERESDISDVGKCVRFSLIPSWFLETIRKRTCCIKMNRVIENPSVKDMIIDAITYNNIERFYSKKLLKNLQLAAPLQRKWVYDKGCKYHYRSECPNMECISYASFLEYLEQIRNNGKEYWRSLQLGKGTKEINNKVLN